MNPELDEIRAQLEADGLIAKPSGEDALWICATVQEVGAGIRLSNDASMLIREDGEWRAIFPGTGLSTYVTSGTLGDLVPLIRMVYANYRLHGGLFREAFSRSVPDPDSHLSGLPSEHRPSLTATARPMEVGGGFGA